MTTKFCMECKNKVGNWSARFGGNNTIFCKKCFAFEDIVKKHVNQQSFENKNIKEQAALSFKTSKTVQKLLNEKKEKIKTEEATWFYSTDLEEQIGPVTLSELTYLFNAESINREAIVWSPTIDDWKLITEILSISPTLANNSTSQFETKHDLKHSGLTDFSWPIVIYNILFGVLINFIINSISYIASIKSNAYGFFLHIVSAVGFVIPACIIAAITLLICKRKKGFVIAFWLSLAVSIYGVNA